jgi:hypothetical protein
MVSEYLKSELCMHQWIQLPCLGELKALEVELEIKINTGHHYLDPGTMSILIHPFMTK